jgi:hypothetical protein
VRRKPPTTLRRHGQRENKKNTNRRGFLPEIFTFVRFLSIFMKNMKIVFGSRPKKRGVFVFLMIFPLVGVFGQEEGAFSLGGLVEANANTRHGFAAAGGVLFDYGFTDSFAAGLKLDYGSDFHDVSSMEALAFARYYFFRYSPFNFFFQGGAGYIGLFEGDRMVSTVLADGGLGFRIPIHRFFAEQYIRFGWPTGFGFGLALGYRFGAKPPLPPPEPVVQAPPVRIAQAEPILVPLPQIAYTEDGRITDPQIFFLPYLADFTIPENSSNRPIQQQIIEANRAALWKIASFMKTHPGYTLLIEGYANPVFGTAKEEEDELKPLSIDRAQFIKRQLISLGIEEERLAAIGVGSRGAEKTDIWKNRRVQFYLSLPSGGR